MGARALALPFFSFSTLLLLLFLSAAGPASCDFNQDKDECTDQLVGIATCLTYVTGQSMAPTMDCCTGLKQVLAKSEKCLCILIKDRNDLGLGSYKINATRAVTLPHSCHVPNNASDCIALLLLAPNSTEAKVFQGFANITQSSSNTTPPSSSSSSSSAKEKSGSDGGMKRSRWMIGTEVVCLILLCIFQISLI